jgi:1,4-dihydroxy-2-naphthoate octaprenyltransferase
MSTRVAATEPTPERLANPLVRYVLATRPAFLSITLVGCVLGVATAWFSGTPLHWGRAALTVVLALLAHAAVNVLNDYCDHRSGTDARNTDRIYPFTGGSRFIQNGVLSPRQVLALAWVLFAATIAGGLWLVSAAGAGLAWIGLAGLTIGWGYSAAPLRLNSRGLGEISVAAGFLLVVAGADYVQRGTWAALPWLAGLPYALLVTNILYINQFPDRAADRASGKLHWVARLDPRTASRGYALILVAAFVVLAAGIVGGALPKAAALAFLAFVPALGAWLQLRRFAAQPAHLAPAIRLTLLAGHALPLALALALGLSRP